MNGKNKKQRRKKNKGDKKQECRDLKNCLKKAL